MDKTVKIKVTGRVQGVGFRWCSYEKFVELGLAGQAENASDGSVEITATGDSEKLKELLRWAQKGPEGARVNDMKYEVVENGISEDKSEESR